MDHLTIWSIYFAQLVGWQEHPGNKTRKTVAECAALADDMLLEFKVREAKEWREN